MVAPPRKESLVHFILVLFLTAAFAALLPAPASAEGTITPTAITAVSGEEYGITGNVYEIRTPGELVWFGQSVNDGTIPPSSNAVLLADIDLGGSEWTPVASTQESGYAYTGTFDGNDFSVSNFTVNYTVTAENINTGAGFFASIGSGGTVRGLTVKNATIKSTGITKNEEGVIDYATDVAGGIAGIVYGGTIENCAVEDSSITSEMMAGGIAGQSVDNAVISGCTVSGSVAIAATGLPEEYGVMTTSGAAGIVGGATGGEIADCLYLADKGGSVTRVDGDVYGIAKLDTNTPSTMTNNAFYDPKIEDGSNVNDSGAMKLTEENINNGMTVTGVTLTPDAPVSLSAGESMEFTLDTLPTAGKIAAAIKSGVVKVDPPDEGNSGVVTIDDESAFTTEGKLTITGAKAGTETVTITVTVYKVNYSTMQPDESSPTEYTFELAAEVGGTTPTQPGGSGSTGGGGGGCSAGFGALALLPAVPLLFRRKK